MAADVSRVVAEVKKALTANDLTSLFESVLVWDDGLNTSQVQVGTATAKYIASKARVPAWLITAETEAEVDALDKRLRKESFERLLVWQRPQGRTWLFPEKTSSGTRRSKTTESNLEAIAQRLAELRFEPGGQSPTVLDVKERLQRTFSVVQVTEKFYKEFKDIHDRLGGRRADKKPKPLLRGLPDINASRWYASVLLNRLMFLYRSEEHTSELQLRLHLVCRLLLEKKTSWDYFERHGQMMPDNWRDVVGSHDAIYFGAVGWPAKIADHVSLWGSLLLFRREFDQYINLRPARLMPGITAPVVRKDGSPRQPGEIDMYIVRENTEGEYSAVGGRMFAGTEREMVMQESIFTRSEEHTSELQSH